MEIQRNNGIACQIKEDYVLVPFSNNNNAGLVKTPTISKLKINDNGEIDLDIYKLLNDRKCIVEEVNENQSGHAGFMTPTMLHTLNYIKNHDRYASTISPTEIAGENFEMAIGKTALTDFYQTENNNQNNAQLPVALSFKGACDMFSSLQKQINILTEKISKLEKNNLTA